MLECLKQTLRLRPIDKESKVGIDPTVYSVRMNILKVVVKNTGSNILVPNDYPKSRIYRSFFFSFFFALLKLEARIAVGIATIPTPIIKTIPVKIFPPTVIGFTSP